MKMAVICGEDQRFKDHMGFDFKAIEKAIEHNIKGGKTRGASTISQQTAKTYSSGKVVPGSEKASRFGLHCSSKGFGAKRESWKST